MRGFIKCRLLAARKPRLYFIPGVGGGRARARATHVASRRPTPPPVEHTGFFGERENTGLVVGFGVGRPRPVAQVATVLVEEDLDESALTAAFENLVMRVANRRKTATPVFFCLSGKALRLARDAENFSSRRVDRIEDA